LLKNFPEVLSLTAKAQRFTKRFAKFVNKVLRFFFVYFCR
jgi:hypothetical protein